MELKERFQLMLSEQHMRQRELAGILGVTEGYISAILLERGKKVSKALALLIESKFGYNAEWVLTGEGDKYKAPDGMACPTEAHARVMKAIERLPERYLLAVMAFMDSLENVDKALAGGRRGGAAAGSTAAGGGADGAD
jgi:transcriptional regulator with XRE-family HTH domain